MTTTTKETSMDETTKAAIKRLGIPQYRWNRMSVEEQKDALLGRVLQDGRKRAMREAMPAEPERRPQDTEEPVIWFQKTFGNDGGQVYTYIAQRVRLGSGYRWEVAIRSHVEMLTWPQLCEFAMLRDGMPVFYRASAWEVVS